MFVIVSSPCLSLIFQHFSDFSDIQLSVEEAVLKKKTHHAGKMAVCGECFSSFLK